MKNQIHPIRSLLLSAAGLALCATTGLSQTPATSADKPYSVLKTVQYMGTGGLDYVFADNAGRKLYIPRGDQVLAFDLDTLKAAGSITNTRARGATVDPKSHHGFASSKPVAMWDTQTMQPIKTIDVQGNPDGIAFEPSTEKVYVFSHSAPNVTVIEPKDGSVVGTIDLGGAPEQSASDGKGHLYVDLEDKNMIAVVDVNTMKVTANYPLEGKGGTPAGLAMDVKNRILFAFCRNPATAVIMNADDGKIIATLPIGSGTDGGGFNANTMEAFSSQGDGTLTIIKENSPTSFTVAQTVTTKPRAKTSTLDTKNNQIILITTEAAPVPAADGATPPTPAAGAAPGGRGGRGGGRGGGGGPAFLDIIVVGR